VANFNSFADVSEWVDVHSVEELRDAVATPGRFNHKNREYASAWLNKQTEDGKIAREEEAHGFMRRQTAAAERAARIAWLSMWISLAALFIAAWPAFDLAKRWLG
jgi:hypothetical protein